MKGKKLVSARTFILLFLCCVFWSLAGCESPVNPWPPDSTAEIRVGSHRAAYTHNTATMFWSKGVMTSFYMDFDYRERSSGSVSITVLNPSSIASGRTVDAKIGGYIDGHYFVSGTPAVIDEAKIRIHFGHIEPGLRAYCSGTISGMAFLDPLDDPVPLSGSFEKVPIFDPQNFD